MMRVSYRIPGDPDLADRRNSRCGLGVSLVGTFRCRPRPISPSATPDSGVADPGTDRRCRRAELSAQSLATLAGVSCRIAILTGSGSPRPLVCRRRTCGSIPGTEPSCTVGGCRIPRLVALFFIVMATRAASLTGSASFVTCSVSRSTLLAFDYRGYGKSGGSPSEAGLFQDVRAAL